MKRAGFLFDKIISVDNLLLAHQNARRKKKKTKEIQRIDADPEKYCQQLHDMLASGTFHTSEYHEFTKIDSGKERHICELPYFPDRIVHWAILQAVGPIFMKQFISQTYAALPDKGPHAALETLKGYLHSNPLRRRIVSS